MPSSRIFTSAASGIPTQLTTNGLLVCALASAKVCTVMSACFSVNASHTAAISTFGSESRIFRLSRMIVGSTSPWAVISTGLLVAPNTGTTCFSAAVVSSLNVATCNPSSSARSAISAPAPPERVMKPMPLPAGRAQWAAISTMSSNCSSLRARMSPAMSRYFGLTG